MKRCSLNRGFSLTEMLVSIAVAGLVASLSMATISKARSTLRATQCLNNQRQISHGLQMFYNAHRTFPSDSPSASLRVSLAPYVGQDPSIFHCPLDMSGSPDSYQPYYVRRQGADGEPLFALGCPRHRSANCVTSLFGDSSAAQLRPGKILVGGQPVSPADTIGAGAITSGSVQFADASQVRVTSATSDFKLSVVESFHLADGTLYTIVRVRGDGSIQCTVTPGSKFEVVTPSAVCGVRGTIFTVTVSNNGTQTTVQVSRGHVWLRDKLRGRTRELGVGQSATVQYSPTNCIHCVRHCHAGRHCNECPLNPQYAAAMTTLFGSSCSYGESPAPPGDDGVGYDPINDDPGEDLTPPQGDDDDGDDDEHPGPGDDGNNGHGNDPGGNDPSNPGQGGRHHHGGGGHHHGGGGHHHGGRHHPGGGHCWR